MKHAVVRDNVGLFFGEWIWLECWSLSLCLIRRCCECGASLSHWYYEKDNRLFCKKDYWAKFGQLCHGCSEPITTGLIMVSPNRPKPNLCHLSSPHSPAVHPSVLQFVTAAPVTPFSADAPFTQSPLPYHSWANQQHSCVRSWKSCYL